MGATVAGPSGEEVPVEMGCYGIGVSRLVGAVIEAYHDERGITWPESVAPYRVGLINLRPGDAACAAMGEDLYGRLRAAGVEVLYDDRADESPGVRFATMDLIGLPLQAVVGPRGAKRGVVEFRERRGGGGAQEELTPEALLNRLTAA